MVQLCVKFPSFYFCPFLSLLVRSSTFVMCHKLPTTIISPTLLFRCPCWWDLLRTDNHSSTQQLSIAYYLSSWAVQSRTKMKIDNFFTVVLYYEISCNRRFSTFMLCKAPHRLLDQFGRGMCEHIFCNAASLYKFSKKYVICTDDVCKRASVTITVLLPKHFSWQKCCHNLYNHFSRFCSFSPHSYLWWQSQNLLCLNTHNRGQHLPK